MRVDADLVLLTERRFENPTSASQYAANILLEDRLLAEALTRRGVRSQRIDWSRPDVDWSAVPFAVFRTTWDYFLRWSEFRAWLARARRQTCLVNTPALVDWNTDKHYLRDLEASGLPIVPTRYFDRGAGVELEDAMRESGWREVVLKPAVSGGGRDTYRIERADVHRHADRFRALVAAEDMLLQEFVGDVLRGGEVTLVLFDGVFSHAVRKIAAPGEFRVQDDFGGTVHPHDATADEIALAEAAFAACPGRPVYGRVDLVRGRGGEPLIMEVEIVEPELWLRMCAGSAERFAEALVRAMGR